MRLFHFVGLLQSATSIKSTEEPGQLHCMQASLLSQWCPNISSQPKMAPRGSKGKTPDRSTAWSTFDWDPRGFWVATRLDANGRVQYDYRYPEGAQAAQDQQNTPRSPGPNVFNTADIQYSTTTSTNDTDYGNYGYAGSENNDVYITSNDSVSSYAKVSEYDVPSTSTTGGTFRTMNDVSVSDPESVSTVRYSTATTNPSYVVSPTYSIAPQPPEDTKACVTQSFGDLTITNTSTSLQQGKHTPHQNFFE